MSKKKKAIDKLLQEAIILKEEEPYELPENWIYFKFTSLLDIQGGTQPPKSQFVDEYRKGYVRLVQIRDFSSDKYRTYIPDTDKLRKIEDEDILIARYGASIGRILTGLNGAYNVALAKVIFPEQMINREYLYWLLKSEHFQRPLKSISRSAQSGFNKNDLSYFNMPLPPLNEQKRIAEKLERLLSKIDEAKQLIDEAKETFELRRAAILDEAICGDLTGRWREENANIDILEVENHLNKLKSSKEYSPIKSNTLKIKPIDKEDEPFDLPKGWKWVRLGEISYYITSGSRGWSKYYAENGAFFIRTQDINKNKLNLENTAYVLLPEKIEGKRSLVEPFDLLTTITGANVGKCALVEEELPEAYVSQSVALTKLIDKDMAEYVHLSLLSNSGGGGELGSRAYGIGRPVLSLEDIKSIRIPIAPYKERQMIIDLVKKVLEKEDEIATILMTEVKLNHLKQSILSKAFRGELGTNDPNEESAIELLKSVPQENLS